MFGFDGPEIAVIAVVALICIGPKDMPVAIRAMTGAIKKMRRMAGEFQSHVDDMLKEADLHEVSDTLRDMRGLSVRGAISRAVDPDGSIGRHLSDPFHDRPVPPVTEHFVPHREAASLAPPPDFLPPGARPPMMQAPEPIPAPELPQAADLPQAAVPLPPHSAPAAPRAEDF